MRLVSTLGWPVSALAALLFLPAAARGPTTYAWTQPPSGGRWRRG